MINKTPNTRQNDYQKYMKPIMGFCVFALVFVYVCISVLNYRFPSAKIHGVSMLPNYQVNKVYVTERTFEAPKRFEVVVLKTEKFPDSVTAKINGALGDIDLYVKRVIGLPGDTIAYDKYSGRLLSVNAEPVLYNDNADIPPFTLTDKKSPDLNIKVVGKTMMLFGSSVDLYMSDNSMRDINPTMMDFIAKIRLPFNVTDDVSVMDNVVYVNVPTGSMFIMSDNRFEGIDSRHFGVVPIDSTTSVLRRESDSE